MTVGLVTVPRVLREKLGEDGADALVEFLNNAQVVQRTGLDLFGEKLENRLAQLQREIAEDLNRLRQDVDKKLDAVRQDVDQKLDGLRSFTLGVVGVGVALISFVVVLVQWVK